MTVVCIGSGPSLTVEDCELVRKSGHLTVVTNTTFRLCPWADVLYGFDSKWWKHYQEEVKDFAGEKLSSSMLSEKYGAKMIVLGHRNSGACAIAIALSRGAAQVILLGYDASFDGKKRHWHADHPKGLENAGSVKHWPAQFARLAKKGNIVNASRKTALTCFQRVSLEEVL